MRRDKKIPNRLWVSESEYGWLDVDEPITGEPSKLPFGWFIPVPSGGFLLTGFSPESWALVRLDHQARLGWFGRRRVLSWEPPDEKPPEGTP